MHAYIHTYILSVCSIRYQKNTTVLKQTVLCTVGLLNAIRVFGEMFNTEFLSGQLDACLIQPEESLTEHHTFLSTDS